MASGALSTKALLATAVLTGSFLSGSMMTISLIAIPVLLDTTSQPSQLFHQWIRMFHYGHRAHPTMAALTFTLYASSAWRQRTANRPFGALLLAGVVTVLTTPFTWVVMLPTNRTIADLAGRTRDAAVISIEEAKELVVRWSWLHLVRSVFPLVGAVVGMNRVFGG
ncbi:hypothetical protein BDW62DRAFT_203850 [Aspergillus aurantiobrunneus]